MFAGHAVTPLTRGFRFPASVSGHSIRDQFGEPWLMIGDTTFGLMANLILASDVNQFFSTRAGQGFNACYVNVLTGSYDYNTPPVGNSATWRTSDAVYPFFQSDGVTAGTGPANYSIDKPNPTYFARLDTVVSTARQYGITLFLNPFDISIGDQSDNPGFLGGQGTTKCTAYGSFLGNRYKSQPNVMWQHGNDYGGSTTTWSYDSLIGAMVDAIRTAAPAQLQAIELNFNPGSTGFDNSVYRPGGSHPLDLDGVYEYGLVAPRALLAYQGKDHSGTAMGVTRPSYFMEGNYESNSNTPIDPNATAFECRMQFWYTMCEGGFGGLYGNGTVFQMITGWQSALTATGAVHMGYVAKPFRENNWQNLVPDGSGTGLLSSQSVGTWSASLALAMSSQSWAAAAVTPFGDFGICYTPVNQALVVDMTKMRGGVLARWYDPTAGTYSAIGSFANSGTHSFTPSATNSTGDTDWVLVLTA